MIAGAVAVMLPLFVFAGDDLQPPVSTHDGVPVDVRFDKTGDGIVDAADWGKMTSAEQALYARESLLALGEDPDVMLLKGKTRVQQYLEGLRSVYDVD